MNTLLLYCQEVGDELPLEKTISLVSPLQSYENGLGVYFLSVGAWPTLGDGCSPI